MSFPDAHTLRLPLTVTPVGDKEEIPLVVRGPVGNRCPQLRRSAVQWRSYDPRKCHTRLEGITDGFLQEVAQELGLHGCTEQRWEKWWSYVCLTSKPVFVITAPCWNFCPLRWEQNASWSDMVAQSGARISRALDVGWRILDLVPEAMGSYAGFLRRVVM